MNTKILETEKQKEAMQRGTGNSRRTRHEKTSGITSTNVVFFVMAQALPADSPHSKPGFRALNPKKVHSPNKCLVAFG